MKLLETILFGHVSAIVRKGKERPLQESDAPPLPDVLNPRLASHAFDNLDTSNFFRFITGAFFGTGVFARRMLTLTTIRMGFVIATPILLKALLEQVQVANAGQGIGVGIVVLAVALGLMGMLGAVILQHHFANALAGFATIVNGMNRRIVTHVLRLRHSSRASMNTGDLVNHLASDTDAIAESAFFFTEFFAGALETILILIVLFVYLGWAALAAIATLILLSPFILIVANRYRKLDHHIMELRDERVTLMSQILQGIRVVKFHAWESSVHAEVAAVRRKEISTRVKIVLTDAMSTVLFVSTTTIVAFSAFITYVALGGTLNAPLVFACIALFAMLEDPFGMISHLLANLQHARVATLRLDVFFKAGTRNIDERMLTRPEQPIGVDSKGLVLRYPDAGVNALNNVTLSIKPGESVAIIGSVGAGKSTLLRTLAGLHQTTSGEMVFTNVSSVERQRSGYVPQEAFILNTSLRENIIFGSDDIESHEQDRTIAEIIEDCALEQDLRLFPAGLETEIGERGVNLSGGQKQRVALARAAYHAPGIVFLDDPLSAVDVSTEEVLVDKLLFSRWKNITRVVVTHRLAHLDRFDRIVVMSNGEIVAQGSLADVSPFLSEALEQAANGERRTENVISVSSHADGVHAVPHSPDVDDVGEASRITEDEDRDTGAVRMDVYWHYVKSMVTTHPVLAPILFISLVGTAAAITVFPILQTSWMGYWTDTFASKTTQTMSGIKGFWHSVVGNLNIDVSDPLIAVSIYGFLGTVVLGGWMIERVLWLYRSAAAAREIHNSALAGVLGAPVRFFDSTPIGRVLNRFARDMEGVDDHLSWNFEQSVKSMSQTIGSLILILTVLPLIILVVVPVLFFYYKVQRDYRVSAREAKRLESVARSPRYAHFKEMVTGLDVIHGFGREKFFMDSFYSILGNYQRVFWCSILLNRWFSIRVPLLSGLISVVTSVGIIVLTYQGAITAGVAGVVLTYALSFWMNLNWTIRAFSEVESRMTSVERLRRYGTLKAEPRTTFATPLPAATKWPTVGAVEVKDLRVRYAAHLPLVLNGISFSVSPRSKVGIVGRTGSGKSTLFQTMFRFVEPESGAIEIDGVNIGSVPLQRLRRSLAIIPQDPTLFIGTVRNNLDRFNECTDEEVWTALKRVQLADLIHSLPGELNAKVNEGGLNFSQGQRQLLCMARAILTDARVIVLDEATASVDLETDALIQQTIREEFKDVTVLIIAHRLDTVEDADLIVELDSGRVIRTIQNASTA